MNMRSPDQIQADYETYRGRCKELSQAECEKDPTLRLVRGHVFVPIWNVVEPHWWCARPDGEIVDPSVLQFPAKPLSYEEYDGTVECCNCGKSGREEEFSYLGSGDYFACSTRCGRSFLGI